MSIPPAPLHAWRIVKSNHARTAFSGEGARRFGGRWNPPGVPIVYLAGSTSLAILEMLVHLNSPDLLKRYVLFELTFPPSLLTAVPLHTLPRNWRESPSPFTLQKIGAAWAAAQTSPILRVPSAIVPTEHNFLLNPLHVDFSKIIIHPKQPLKFDPRLLK